MMYRSESMASDLCCNTSRCVVCAAFRQGALALHFASLHARCSASCAMLRFTRHVQERLTAAEAEAAEAAQLRDRVAALEAELEKARASEEAQRQLEAAQAELQRQAAALAEAEGTVAALRRDKAKLERTVARHKESGASRVFMGVGVGLRGLAGVIVCVYVVKLDMRALVWSAVAGNGAVLCGLCLACLLACRLRWASELERCT